MNLNAHDIANLHARIQSALEVGGNDPQFLVEVAATIERIYVQHSARQKHRALRLYITHRE